MFKQITDSTTETLTFKVEVSYMEIYNEKVRDLLGDVRTTKKGGLKVREHKTFGPYVEGLKKLAVQDYSAINRLMEEGNRSRTVAATNMNSESSRSHAVFTIVITQLRYDELADHIGEKVSKISLVDLAGSERAGKTGATGRHLREGSNINKSLTTLGLVISALADRSAKSSSKMGSAFIPYRDSTLTWLLKENLGGNSKTVMVATLSPAADNYEETLSTLRYADRAKQIVNHAIVNEDPNEAMIRELRDEVDRLKAQLGVSGPVDGPEGVQELRDKLQESEALMADLNVSWEEKLRNAEQALELRQQGLEDLGISLTGGGIAVDMTKSYLINLNADPAMNEMLVYYLKDTATKIGTKYAPTHQDIVLSGLGIAEEHAVIDVKGVDLYARPIGTAQVFVNGQQITEPTLLAHGFRLGCGSNHFFRVNTSRRVAESELEDKQVNKEAAEETDRNDSWEEAQREIVMKANTEWEAEKQLALDEQNRLFEAKIAALKQEGRLQEEGAKEQARLDAEREAQEAELEREMLRKEVVDISTLIREANDLCDALGFELKFQIKMQLSLGALVTDQLHVSENSSEDREIAITVKDLRRGGVRHKSYEKFLLQLEFLRDSYDKLNDGEVEKGSVPMYFEPGGAELIGVSSLFLSQVQHGMTVELSPTIVGQDGKAYGQLMMELVVEPKTLAEEEYTGAARSAITPLAIGDMVRMTLTIIEARDIPHTLSTFVNARYMLFDSEEVMIPEMLNGQGDTSGTMTRRKRFNSGSASNGTNGVVVHFDKTAASSVEIPVTESFLEYIQHSKLTVQVWGHNVSMTNSAANLSRANSRNTSGQHTTDSPQVSRKAAALLGIEVTPELERQQAHHGFSERWRNHRHVMGVWTEIHELDDEGAYNPVGTFAEKTVRVGPVQQIRQGYARRLKIRILPSFDTDPLMITKVSSVRIGDVSVMPVADCSGECTSNLGDADLDIVRGEFSAVLNNRKSQLDEKMRDSLANEELPEEEKSKLMEQWMALVAENDALLRPEPNSGLPGAASTKPVDQGFEARTVPVYHPVSASAAVRPLIERGPDMLELHIINQKVDEYDRKVEVTVSWDATAHDNPDLLKITDGKKVVFMKLQIGVQLVNCGTELIFNKLVALRLYKRNFEFSRGGGFFSFRPVLQTPRGTGANYEVITSLPLVENDEDESEETHTESATAQLRQNVESLASLVQIDKLKQSLAMQNAKVTPPNHLRNIIGRPRAESFSGRHASALRRGHTAPTNLGTRRDRSNTSVAMGRPNSIAGGQLLASTVTLTSDLYAQLDHLGRQNPPDTARMGKIKDKIKELESARNDGFEVIDRRAGTRPISAPTVMPVKDSATPAIAAEGGAAAPKSTTCGFKTTNGVCIDPGVGVGGHCKRHTCSRAGCGKGKSSALSECADCMSGGSPVRPNADTFENPAYVGSAVDDDRGGNRSNAGAGAASTASSATPSPPRGLTDAAPSAADAVKPEPGRPQRKQSDPAMMGLFRQKLSSSSSGSELRAVGHLIQGAKEEGSIVDADLDVLRTVYLARAEEIKSATNSPAKPLEVAQVMSAAAAAAAASASASAVAGASDATVPAEATPVESPQPTAPTPELASGPILQLQPKKRVARILPTVPSSNKSKSNGNGNGNGSSDSNGIGTVNANANANANGPSPLGAPISRTASTDSTDSLSTSFVVVEAPPSNPASIPNPADAWIKAGRSSGIRPGLVGAPSVTASVASFALLEAKIEAETAVEEAKNKAASDKGGALEATAEVDVNTEAAEAEVQAKAAAAFAAAAVQLGAQDEAKATQAEAEAEAEAAATAAAAAEAAKPRRTGSGDNLRAELAARRARKAKEAEDAAKAGRDAVDSGPTPLKAILQARREAAAKAAAASTGANQHQAAPAIPEDAPKVGDRASVSSTGQAGVVQYVGPVAFAKGTWCGIELDSPLGKNDGCVQGVRYFTCPNMHGTFTPIGKAKRA